MIGGLMAQHLPMMATAQTCDPLYRNPKTLFKGAPHESAITCKSHERTATGRTQINLVSLAQPARVGSRHMQMDLYWNRITSSIQICGFTAMHNPLGMRWAPSSECDKQVTRCR